MNRIEGDSIIHIFRDEVNFAQLDEIIQGYNEDPTDSAAVVTFVEDMSYKVSEYMLANYEIDVWEEDSYNDHSARLSVVLAGLIWIAIETEYDIENWPDDFESFNGDHLEGCLWALVDGVLEIATIQAILADVRNGATMTTVWRTVKVAVRRVASAISAAIAIANLAICIFSED